MRNVLRVLIKTIWYLTLAVSAVTILVLVALEITILLVLVGLVLTA